MARSLSVLVIDIGRTHVKILVSREKQSREFRSGSKLTSRQMVAGVKKRGGDWKYNTISIGYTGMVMGNRPVVDLWEKTKRWR